MWRGRAWTALLTLAPVALPLQAGEWPAWRGPHQNGVADDTGLVSSWSPAGENLIWKAPLTARSTPVVFDGRACTNGRVGEGDLRQEFVACFDAGTGAKLWEHRFNVYHTAVPWNRVGWASLAADPETGYLYAQGVGGAFLCLDRAGKVVWERNLAEQLGFFSGFGGRTQTPLVDEERVIVSFVSGSWGEWAPPRHRIHAFDKRTGELLWVSTPGGAVADLNVQANPVVAMLGGQRLLLQGHADGWLHAVKARTGEKVWSFHVSKLALNTTPAVAGDLVFAAHSEENVDGGAMGRLVAIDGTGTGDVTASHERWRAGLESGFPSPVAKDGRLYVIDNSANLYALDAGSGRTLWTHGLGTVGKASPVWADGKLYATEVNGRIHILAPGPDGVRPLDEDQIHMPDGRPAEVYGSPAVAYGRVYFTTEEGLYCLGDAKKPFQRPSGQQPPPWPVEEPAAAGAAAAALLAVPAEAWIRPGESASLRALAFDARGRALGPREAVWSLQGLAGTIEGGRFVPDPAKGTQVGKAVAKVGELTASARVRVLADPPLAEDFEATAVGSRPAYFLGALARFEVQELEGGKVLAKGPAPEGVHRHRTFLGPDSWADYTIQADLMGTQAGRKVPDLGLIASGYTADLMGAHQQIQVRSWESELRASKQVPFAWEFGVWYTMRLAVATAGGKSVVRVKVWKRGEPEPADWTLTAEDPLPIPRGSPGLYGFSPAPVYFDNVKVTRNPS